MQAKRVLCRMRIISRRHRREVEVVVKQWDPTSDQHPWRRKMPWEAEVAAEEATTTMILGARGISAIEWKSHQSRLPWIVNIPGRGNEIGLQQLPLLRRSCLPPDRALEAVGVGSPLPLCRLYVQGRKRSGHNMMPEGRQARKGRIPSQGG